MTEPAARAASCAVVIPCFRVQAQILGVLGRIGPEVGWIFVIDDACPEETGALVTRECRDPRVKVIRHERNLGVGGAMVSGYRAALGTPARVVVKLDGDGQMDPALIPQLIRPVLQGRADFVKGNRFHHLGDTAGMPALRLLGNAALSFLSKLSTGYWQMFDPTNGFTAMHRAVLALLPLERLSQRYFFESDVLYQLNQVRAVLCELPMRAVYGGENSSLEPMRMIGPFLRGNLANLARRVINSYFVRGFSLASVELALGIALGLFGFAFGLLQWWHSHASGVPATAGTVMLAALPIILGMQLCLSWLNFDVAAEPRQPISALISDDDPAP